MRSRAAGLLLLLSAAAAPPAGTQGLPAEDAALLLSGEQGGALPLESAAVVWRVDGGQAELRVSLELPVADLLAGGAEQVGLRWAVYAVDRSGSLVASLVRSASADRSRLETSGAAGVRVIETLAAPAVPLSIRTLVRTLDSPRFGLRTVELDAAAGPRAFVPRRREGWIELGAATSGAAPAALATARAGGRLELLVPEGADVAAGSWVLAGTATQDAPPPPPVPATVLESKGEAGGGWRRVALAIPEEAEGSRRLRRGSDPSGSGASILVLSAQAPAGPAWPQVAGATPPRTAPGPQLPAVAGGPPAPEVREELVGALAATADRGPGAGASALRRALAGAFETAGDAGAAVFGDEGLRLGVEVVRAEPESLAPLLATLELAYRTCRQDAVPACSRVASALFRGLLEAEESAGAPATSLHADGWTLLGWWAIERQVHGQAAEDLRRAARLDPGHVSSRLALAVLLELSTDYGEAAGVLEELAERHPDLGEARLRLGVQYRRLGRRRAAVEKLAEAYDRGPEWVRVVARQELAALQDEGGDAAGAEETLRRAVAEFPAEEQLKIQLAALLDASGRLIESHALLDDLAETAEEDLAARHQYGTMPVAELHAARARLQASGEAERQALRSALKAIAP